MRQAGQNAGAANWLPTGSPAGLRTRRDADDEDVYTDQYNTLRQTVLGRASAWPSGSYLWLVLGIVGVLYCKFALFGVLCGTR